MKYEVVVATAGNLMMAVEPGYTALNGAEPGDPRLSAYRSSMSVAL